MINIVICGANGKMGQKVAQAIAETDDMRVCCGVDLFPDAKQNDFPVYTYIEECEAPFDVVVDFSRPDALESNLAFAIKKQAAIVICTTGFSDDDKAKILQAAEKTPVFFTANMSLGVNLQMELAKKAAEFLGEAYDIEIIEKHHNQKVDSPSGTALAIAEHINEAFDGSKEFVYGRHSKTDKRDREIGIHGVRGGTIVGEHTVLFAGTDEIIEIKHAAQSRNVFAHGALRAAKFLAGKPAGLYGMADML
ncbi:MAG: 4-hydroxy-tetrahydrodipicolinate reductase, partial [Clostridia bacterium]|nr:4-hydroxy-tetrahydrodipicolinate reductase [Clostridia bacterium]